MPAPAIYIPQKLSEFTNDIGAGGGGGSGGDLLAALLSAEVAITAATTLTNAAFGKLHVCSGTTANYTVTLPAASGNAGKLIGFRMASALTKLVTLDGNASETIDGATTRIMWAQEVAILLCDGTGWTKIAGRSIPMSAQMLKSSNTAVSATTVTKLNLNVVQIDTSGAMCNTGTSLISILRPAVYVVTGQLTAEAASVSPQVRIHRNGSSVAIMSQALSPYMGVQYTARIAGAAADFIELYTYLPTAGTLFGAGGDLSTSLTVAEEIAW